MTSIEEINIGEAEKLLTSKQQRKKTKQMQILDGSYKWTLLDLAKVELMRQENPSIVRLAEDPKFKSRLGALDYQKLSTYLNNQLAKNRKLQSEIAKKEPISTASIDKAKRLSDTLIPDLHRELLNFPHETERKSLIELKIGENLFLFLDYMEAYEKPFPEFLNIVVGLHSNFETDVFVKLFARVCAQHRGEDISINLQMVESAMVFLVESKIDHIAACGLLRLTFQNSLSLKPIHIQVLNEFQLTYAQSIPNFIKSLPHIKPQLNSCLPASLYLFTTPIIKIFKEGGITLYNQIPPIFLTQFIEIVCLSFTEDQLSVDRFIAVFKQGCLKHFEALELKNFTNVLELISSKIKDASSQFFGSLDQATLVVERSFNLIKEKKIDKFDRTTSELIVYGGAESYSVMSSRPSMIRAGPTNEFAKSLEAFMSMNPGRGLEYMKSLSQLTKLEIQFFDKLGISRLLPHQHLCLKYCANKVPKRLEFIQYETGQGKTALCLGIAFLRAFSGNNVMILNSSEELTFRDHKRASSALSSLNVPLIRLSSMFSHSDKSSYVAYASVAELKECLKSEPLTLKKMSCIIVDEFDTIFLAPNQDFSISSALEKDSPSLFAFTGSDLQPHHLQHLRSKLNGSFVNFFRRGIEKQAPVQLQTKLHSTWQDMKEEIQSTCIDQCLRTPVIIITGANSEKIRKALHSQGLAVESLCTMQGPSAESAMTIFCKRQGELFPVFIINEEQGRGIDFPSTSDIESNSGNFVLITILPTSFLQYQQFIGRTGRISNKGQFKVVLQDKDARNCDPDVYLEKKLEELRLLEFQFLTSGRLTHGSSGALVAKTIDTTGRTDELQPTGLVESILTQRQTVEFELGQIISADGPIWASDQKLMESPLQPCKSQTNEKLATAEPVSSRRREDKFAHKEEVKGTASTRARLIQHSHIDEGYFSNYENYDIHREMLDDSIRMKAYQSALLQQAPGKVIADVGAGTGALSIMAARAGAKYVYGIEACGIANVAKQAIVENLVQDRVSIINDMAERAALPVSKVDVIVSEWMGYMLLFENVLPSVLAVRDGYLIKGGLMIPSRAIIRVAGFGRRGVVDEMKMSSLERAFLNRALVQVCTPDSVVTQEVTALDLDLYTLRANHTSFSSDFVLKASDSGGIEGLVCWFDVLLGEGIWLSTSPLLPATHWKQTILPFQKGFELSEGETLVVKMDIKPQEENHRALDIRIKAVGPERFPHANLEFSLD